MSDAFRKHKKVVSMPIVLEKRGELCWQFDVVVNVATVAEANDQQPNEPCPSHFEEGLWWMLSSSQVRFVTLAWTVASVPKDTNCNATHWTYCRSQSTEPPFPPSSSPLPRRLQEEKLQAVLVVPNQTCFSARPTLSNQTWHLPWTFPASQTKNPGMNRVARIGRPDILWSVNKLARSITKWTKACHKQLSRLISYIHHTCEYKHYCHVGNTAKQCRLGLFQDSDFAGDLEDSKSTSGVTLCIFGSHTFVPISWLCKKQTSVSHPHLIYGIWSSQFFTETRIRVLKNGETRAPTLFVQQLMEWLMIWTMLIVFPQTSNLLVRKLCCICSRTTKQRSRWS